MARIQQADDLRAESDALYAILAPLDERELSTVTQFQGWTFNDVLRHLHYFDWMAERAWQAPDEFQAELSQYSALRSAGDTAAEAVTKRLDGLKGLPLLERWRSFVVDMAERFATADPKARVQWVGPSMSVRSSLTARHMETWAHAQAIYDQLGLERVEVDRIKNIAHLGVQTFGWTFHNRGESVPDVRPVVVLIAPSGAVWSWGEPSEVERISGPAVDFCRVVAQTRNIADTSLVVQGPIAKRWMSVAQCFAGAVSAAPPPGSRYRQKTRSNHRETE